MSADYMVATLISTADGLARVANFLEMFPETGRKAWMRDFIEHGVITEAEGLLIDEFFDDPVTR